MFKEQTFLSAIKRTNLSIHIKNNLEKNFCNLLKKNIHHALYKSVSVFAPPLYTLNKEIRKTIQLSHSSVSLSLFLLKPYHTQTDRADTTHKSDPKAKKTSPPPPVKTPSVSTPIQTSLSLSFNTSKKQRKPH